MMQQLVEHCQEFETFPQTQIHQIFLEPDDYCLLLVLELDEYCFLYVDVQSKSVKSSPNQLFNFHYSTTAIWLQL